MPKRAVASAHRSVLKSMPLLYLLEPRMLVSALLLIMEAAIQIVQLRPQQLVVCSVATINGVFTSQH